MLLIILLLVLATIIPVYFLWPRSKKPSRLSRMASPTFELRRLPPGAPPRAERALDRARNLRGQIVVMHETAKQIGNVIHITPHVMILREAVAKGLVLLDGNGKIAGKRPGVNIELPVGTLYMNVFAIRPSRFQSSGGGGTPSEPAGTEVPTPWPTSRRG